MHAERTSMDDYEKIEKIGSGSYGIVIKCRHKGTGEVVAIKKFHEAESDPQIRKIAAREVKMLKHLKHGNLVCLKSVFRRKRKLHMVFEYMDHSLLNELERHTKGLPSDLVRKVTWQCLNAVEHCHKMQVVHRDVKPENILVSKNGLVKLCDFGFARRLDTPPAGYTDYVATRWYRAPELLVGDTRYDSTVDIWAIGCLFGEMLTGRPVWPGKSDVDQLWRIISTLGATTARLEDIFLQNPFFTGVKIPTCDPDHVIPIEQRYKKFGNDVISLMNLALKHNSADRGTCKDMKANVYFDGFREWFEPELVNLLAEPPLYMNPPPKGQQRSALKTKSTTALQHVKNAKHLSHTSELMEKFSISNPKQDAHHGQRTQKRSKQQNNAHSDGHQESTRRTKLNGITSMYSQKVANIYSSKSSKADNKSRSFRLPTIGK